MKKKVMEKIDTTMLEGYLKGRGELASAEIMEKKKDYYLTSADKTLSRLELAKIRLKHSDLSESEVELLTEKISQGLDWLKVLKTDINKFKDDSEFDSAVYYNKWYLLKLLPAAVEGYFITKSVQSKISRITGNISASSHRMQLRSAEKHNEKAKTVFHDLINLNENSDLENSQNLCIKAYSEVSTAQDILKTKFSQTC